MQQPQQKLPLTETNGKLTLNSLKTQASFLSSTASSSSPSSITTSTITNLYTAASTTTSPTFKSNLTTTTTATTNSNGNNGNGNSKKLTNVCIVRPQLQQQQPTHYQQHQNYGNSSISSVYEGDLKSISPPPLYTPPTPSLWQTPLILETTVPTSTTGIAFTTANNGLMGTMGKSPITTISQTTINTSLKGCVTPTVQSPAVGSITTTSTSTTTAMAKVAPIIVHNPLTIPTQTPPPQLSSQNGQTPNQCLPPSKFHNHTLAQHLQKVECLKKSKRSLEVEQNLVEQIKSITPPLKAPPSPIKHTMAASLKMVDNNCSPVKHSETEDLNEIPVNVIFRMAMVPQTNEKSTNNIQFVKPQSEIGDITQPPKQIPKPPPLIATASANTTTQQHHQFITNVNKKLSTIPASKTIKPQLQQQQQINTSSIQQQNNTTITALNSQPNNNEIKKSEEETNTKILSLPNSKIKNTTHISINKTTRKLNTLNAIATNCHQQQYSNDLSYNLDCSSTTTKGAVAIVKMSQQNIDLDTTHLATASGLPYCLQQYWFNSYDFCKTSSSSSTSDLLTIDKSINRSLAREERIAVYKQQLRRQAMQLLSTRSLQKLPIQVARRRLMCVDRLLRKYQQSEQFKKE